ncbi:MAG: hypothetical protein KKB66_18480 [Alphaproteobacteria bacterium]|uniref:Uncharacterized protein n=1 Tax=viral metagenome TaxID=1070528 RepID=A0A6H1ZH82_9ZZZZ|nr:hypothetical protein [Alphaproteobacteria bacterium]MBU0803591.1 hypothetical protein [Alphaproteobacteria bacterium]MBU0873112.1 hypothetical protein [Alphaproteobacteria bacterium]MBU1402518.1 hypothetical protein [Alphaproteobacteria bacterium]MBU1593160.1 hypothetical protein [Alphaproteobacteria bacterium]
MSIRHYLFPDDEEPLRLSRRLVDGLVHGNDALPRYAGTRQKVASVLLENDGLKPLRIVTTQGAYFDFDETGDIQDGLNRATAEIMDISFSHPLRRNETVVELRPRLAKKRVDEEHRWTLGKAEIDRIVRDVWPKTKSDTIKFVTSASRKRPPLTYEARSALEDASQDFWKIAHAIQRLKEPSQKAFGFEARERSISDPDFPHLYRALADMSDWQLEVQRRHRTGKGTWYAIVEVTVWQDGIGESVERHCERCQGRNKAVLAVRKLLAEHASKFSEHATVEGEIVTDLEWQQRAYTKL